MLDKVLPKIPVLHQTKKNGAFGNEAIRRIYFRNIDIGWNHVAAGLERIFKVGRTLADFGRIDEKRDERTRVASQ